MIFFVFVPVIVRDRKFEKKKEEFMLIFFQVGARVLRISEPNRTREVSPCSVVIGSTETRTFLKDMKSLIVSVLIVVHLTEKLHDISRREICFPMMTWRTSYVGQGSFRASSNEKWLFWLLTSLIFTKLAGNALELLYKIPVRVRLSNVFKNLMFSRNTVKFLVYLVKCA